MRAVDSSRQTKPQHEAKPPPTASEIFSWASQLASESRDIGWIAQWYVWPAAVVRIIRQLNSADGGLIGLVGPQGVGKTSALLAIYIARYIQQHPPKESKTNKKATLPPPMKKTMLPSSSGVDNPNSSQACSTAHMKNPQNSAAGMAGN